MIVPSGIHDQNAAFEKRTAPGATPVPVTPPW